jgi:hypothetical protein
MVRTHRRLRRRPHNRTAACTSLVRRRLCLISTGTKIVPSSKFRRACVPFSTLLRNGTSRSPNGMPRNDSYSGDGDWHDSRQHGAGYYHDNHSHHYHQQQQQQHQQTPHHQQQHQQQHHDYNNNNSSSMQHGYGNSYDDPSNAARARLRRPSQFSDTPAPPPYNSHTPNGSAGYSSSSSAANGSYAAGATGAYSSNTGNYRHGPYGSDSSTQAQPPPPPPSSAPPPPPETNRPKALGCATVYF